MTNWSSDELNKISKDNNLYISIPNSDGTMHKPTWIWIAQAGNDLYARGYNGTNAKWYQSAKREQNGHISVGGVEQDVKFEFPNDEKTKQLVDEGYKLKYKGSSYLPPMISQKSRDSTVKIIKNK